uniref:Coiled-coil domain containing 125 n=1 Tax=Macaca nemestrina TaxID=9545 RepID=A0A2K6C9R7_MACNE
MLDIKQQKMAQENMCCDRSGFAEASGLELAVLGACLCHGPGGSPCSCARMAASTRKLLLQLKQEDFHHQGLRRPLGRDSWVCSLQKTVLRGWKTRTVLKRSLRCS